MSQEIFEKFHKKLKQEKSEIEAKLDQPENKASNPEKAIELAIHLATKLNTVWDCSDYHQKQKLQNLVFPEGMHYNRKNDECRTIRTNSAFLSIAELSRLLDDAKIDNPYHESGLSVWVEVSDSISNQKFLECLQNMHSRLNDGIEKKLLKKLFNNY
jgi:site-specific DNA recombinase